MHGAAYRPDHTITAIPKYQITWVRLIYRKLFFAANERKSVEIDPLLATLPDLPTFITAICG